MTLPPRDVTFIARLLHVVEHDILPLTVRGVASGNKVFGAALLDRQSFSTVLAETNNEIESPLHHGEMHLLKRYYEQPAATRAAPSDLLFLSTHEPCSLCLSAITWCGFDNFFYLFSHEDSRDAFAIPHDLKILKEVFDVDPGGYRRKNAFWESHGIGAMIDDLPDAERPPLSETVERLGRDYAKLSSRYQRDKDSNAIPLR